MKKAALKKAKTKVVSKTKEAAKKTGEYVSKNPKTTAYIVIGAVAIYAGYKLFKAVKGAANVLSGDNVVSNIEVGNALNVNNSNLTITPNQALIHAKSLLDAMNWEGWVYIPIPRYTSGTDTDVIDQIFSNITSDDFKLIYQKFGKKHYNGTGSPQILEGVQDFIGIAEERDLVYWLRSELNSFFDRSLFNKVKAIVEGAGFTFV